MKALNLWHSEWDKCGRMEENKKKYKKARTNIAPKEWVIEKGKLLSVFATRDIFANQMIEDVAVFRQFRINAHFPTFCHVGSKYVKCHTCFLLIMSTNSHKTLSWLEKDWDIQGCFMW